MENIEKFSMDSFDYPSIEEFIRQMDSYNWENVPDNLYFKIDWEAEDPFLKDVASWFWMEATKESSLCSVNTEKAKEEYEKFKTLFLIFSKYEVRIKEYKAKIAQLHKQMYEELRKKDEYEEE